jgi:pimeloyl-ACP methyl ester carboxylesterase
MKVRGIGLLVGLLMIVVGGLLAHFTQTAGGIRIEDVRFKGASGATMSALVYIPPTATEKTPAPGILAVHGYFNSRETQDGFAIEFARRGYVVVALDQRGHGYSDGPAFADGFGGPDGLNYLRSLPYVDKDNVGLEGHSMGGWTVLAAAAAMPDAYKAVVLEGSSTGAPFAKEGTPSWPRNLAVVFSQYDEFSLLMWGSPKPKALAATPKVQAVFGVSEPIEIGKVYGDIAAGTGRVLQQPAVIHPGDHISHEAIGYALDWFGKTLVGGKALPLDDQIWFNKEVGTGIALIGLIVALLGFFDVLLGLPFLSALSATPMPSAPVAASVRGKGVAFWLTVLILVLTFYPAFMFGDNFLPASRWLPQTFGSQIMAWAVINLIITLTLMPFAPRSQERKGIVIPSVLIAVAVVVCAYAAAWAVDLLWKIDFRFWFFALKVPSGAQFRTALIDVAPLTAYFVVGLHVLQRNFGAPGTPAMMHYLTTIGASALGFVLLEVVQYGALWMRGQIINPLPFYPTIPLATIIGINFIPVLTAVAIISTFTWRRTQSSLPGALICGVLVTWYVTVGTASHVAI